MQPENEGTDQRSGKAWENKINCDNGEMRKLNVCVYAFLLLTHILNSGKIMIKI